MPGKYDTIIGSAIVVLVMTVWLGFLGMVLIALFGPFWGAGLLGLMVAAATLSVTVCMSSNAPERGYSHPDPDDVGDGGIASGWYER